MRIRSTKPEFYRSKTIASVEWEVRYVLKGLESYVDDNGVGKDDIALIAADVFPRDLSASPRETLARLSEAISTLGNAGLVVRYEVDGEDLLYIDRWSQHQRIDRPSRGRFPRPDGTLEYGEPVNRESYTSPREDVASVPATLAPGTGEQGNRGTGEQSSSSTIASDPDDTPSDDVIELCELLAEKVRANGTRVPKVGKRWHKACRLLIEVDGKTPQQIRVAINWSQSNPFWSANIQSMQKLREKYDTLRLQAKADAEKRANGGRAVTVTPTHRSPTVGEQCTKPGHSGWATNCAQCRADNLARKEPA